MSTRVMIVDDEPPARARLRQLLAEIPEAELVGEAATGEEALALMPSTAPDVVLLDIRMPGIGGMEAARRMAAMPEPPTVIFTTAYEQHALEAFEAEASGYLLKPVRRERLAAALEHVRRPSRAQRAALQETEPAPRRTHVSVRQREQVRLVPITEVLCFIAEQKYTIVRHLGGEDLIEDSLRSLEEAFDPLFVRIHRNALVSLSQIESLDRDDEGRFTVQLRHGGGRLQVSRRLAAEVQRQLR